MKVAIDRIRKVASRRPNTEKRKDKMSTVPVISTPPLYSTDTWSDFCLVDCMKHKRMAQFDVLFASVADYGCKCFEAQLPADILIVDTPNGPSAHLLWPYSSVDDREGFAYLKECHDGGRIFAIDVGSGPIVETVDRPGFIVRYRLRA